MSCRSNPVGASRRFTAHPRKRHADQPRRGPAGVAVLTSMPCRSLINRGAEHHHRLLAGLPAGPASAARLREGSMLRGGGHTDGRLTMEMWKFDVVATRSDSSRRPCRPGSTVGTNDVSHHPLQVYHSRRFSHTFRVLREIWAALRVVFTLRHSCIQGLLHAFMLHAPT
jgi:hypothetical protein